MRRRGQDARPPAALQIQSPSALDARYCPKRDPEGVGDKPPMSDTGDEGSPALIPQALTTLSTTPDWVMGPTIQEACAQRALLPGTPLMDTGSVDAELLVTAQRPQAIEVVGPPLAS